MLAGLKLSRSIIILAGLLLAISCSGESDPDEKKSHKTPSTPASQELSFDEILKELFGPDVEVTKEMIENFYNILWEENHFSFQVQSLNEMKNVNIHLDWRIGARFVSNHDHESSRVLLFGQVPNLSSLSSDSTEGLSAINFKLLELSKDGGRVLSNYQTELTERFHGLSHLASYKSGENDTFFLVTRNPFKVYQIDISSDLSFAINDISPDKKYADLAHVRRSAFNDSFCLALNDRQTFLLWQDGVWHYRQIDREINSHAIWCYHQGIIIRENNSERTLHSLSFAPDSKLPLLTNISKKMNSLHHHCQLIAFTHYRMIPYFRCRYWTETGALRTQFYQVFPQATDLSVISQDIAQSLPLNLPRSNERLFLDVNYRHFESGESSLLWQDRSEGDWSGIPLQKFNLYGKVIRQIQSIDHNLVILTDNYFALIDQDDVYEYGHFSNIRFAMNGPMRGEVIIFDSQNRAYVIDTLRASNYVESVMGLLLESEIPNPRRKEELDLQSGRIFNLGPWVGLVSDEKVMIYPDDDRKSLLELSLKGIERVYHLKQDNGLIYMMLRTSESQVRIKAVDLSGNIHHNFIIEDHYTRNHGDFYIIDRHLIVHLHNEMKFFQLNENKKYDLRWQRSIVGSSNTHVKVLNNTNILLVNADYLAIVETKKGNKKEIFRPNLSRQYGARLNHVHFHGGHLYFVFRNMNHKIYKVRIPLKYYL